MGAQPRARHAPRRRVSSTATAALRESQNGENGRVSFLHLPRSSTGPIHPTVVRELTELYRTAVCADLSDFADGMGGARTGIALNRGRLGGLEGIGSTRD